jgi:hypothetical protein
MMTTQPFLTIDDVSDFVKSDDVNLFKQGIFFEVGFESWLKASTFEFFSGVVLSIQWDWREEYQKRKNELIGNCVLPVVSPLFLAVRRGYIEHARVLLRANHPHYQQLLDFDYSVFIEVRSFAMFQMLVEEGVSFKLNSSCWPEYAKLSLLKDDDCLNKQWIQYMLQIADKPIINGDVNEIVSYSFLRRLIAISNVSSRATIQFDCIVLLAILLSHVKKRVKVYDNDVNTYILKKYQNVAPLECNKALLVLSMFGIFKISISEPLLRGVYDSSFIYKLSVQSHSFVDALIEHDALKEAEEEEE